MTSTEADLIADYLLTHVGGDETQQWQAGHNYAMTEAARLVREGYHLLDYGKAMDCCACGAPPPHTVCGPAKDRVECGGWPDDDHPDDPDERGTCGGSWSIDQRTLFDDGALPA